MTPAEITAGTVDVPPRRAEIVIHLPTAYTGNFWTAVSEPLQGFLDELPGMPAVSVAALMQALPGLQIVVAVEDEDAQGEELARWVSTGQPQGFLVKVAVPMRGSHFSAQWRWFHGETVEAALEKAEPWARALRERGAA